MRILALDPGVTTGWALFTKGAPDERYTSGQVGPEDRIWTFLESSRFASAQFTPDLELIVMERFQYRNALPKADLTPVKVIGIVEEWSRQRNVPVVLQTPSQRLWFTDERLETLGLLKTPKSSWPHANDAMRHLLVYLSFGEGIQLGENVIQGLRRG